MLFVADRFSLPALQTQHNADGIKVSVSLSKISARELSTAHKAVKSAIAPSVVGSDRIYDSLLIITS